MFLPQGEPRSARKAWIAGAVNPSGTLVVDDGATEALRRGKSLLPAGVVAVEGNFERGDAVIVRTPAGVEAGRGLSAYSSGDIRLVAGHKSREIAAILGYRGRDEMIHRDDRGDDQRFDDGPRRARIWRERWLGSAGVPARPPPASPSPPPRRRPRP